MKDTIKFTLDNKEVEGKILDVVSYSHYNMYQVLITHKVYIAIVANKIVKIVGEVIYDEYTNEYDEAFSEPRVLFEYE